MKKVLFISLAPHNTIGGTQNYNYKLMEIFQKLGWKITEYNCNLGIDVVNRQPLKKVELINNSSTLLATTNKYVEGKRFMKQVKTSNLEVAQLIHSNDYDLIIDTRQHPYTWKKSWGNDPAKSNKMIWVQHFCLGLFDGKYITTNKIQQFFVNLYTNYLSNTRYNVLYSHKNIVLYDKFNEQKLAYKRFKNIKPNIYKISLSEYTKTYINKQNNKTRDIDFLYVGRINNIQKNVKFIDKVFRHFQFNLTMIGSGETKLISRIKNNKNINYLGFKHPKELKQYFLRSKFLFIPSRYEGFGFVIVEALSHGCIPILLDTFESANFFREIGCVLDKKISVKQMQEKLQQIHQEYNDKKVDEAIKFACKNLSNEQFNIAWEKIIKKFG